MAKMLTRLAFALAAVLIASVAFVGAVTFLFYALYLYFVTLISPPLAALATSGFLVVFALLVLLVGRGMAAIAWSDSSERKKREEGESEHPLTGVLGREIGGLAAKNPFIAVGVALGAGLLLGVSPGLRKTFFDFFKR